MRPHGSVPCRITRAPFSRGPMLVNTDTGRGDHDDVAIIGLGGFLHEPAPDACLAPTNKAVVAGGRRAVVPGDFRPRRACPEAPENAIQHPAVIDTGHTARLVRKQWPDDRPFVIYQLVPSPCHRPPSLGGGFESQPGRMGRAFMSLRPNTRHVPWLFASIDRPKAGRKTHR